ncbi:MAG: hypothetical protein HY597_04155 [Candidatus Omnitrophica bacterium]|nr:hypothetical protein [Candidatus Omnitrophota bacterium]
MERKAVALLSGGLDSTLAAKLVIDQGVEVVGLYFSMVWGCCDKLAALKAAQHLGIELMVLKMREDYIELIRKPKYGYGTAMNPCVDCRIYMMRITKRFMASIGASFLVTGEVLGQRPMSQRQRPLAIIEREADLEGLIVRPLSAKLLEPSLPEQGGLVDRQRFLEISGRSRKEQMALAASWGITDYPQPAGGCNLTDAAFALKVKDLLAHDESPTTKDMELLTIGRHVRLTPETKIILGRNQEENTLLEGYAGDGYWCVKPQFPGPAALVVGELTDAATETAMNLIVRYTKVEKVAEEELAFAWQGTTTSRPKSSAGKPESLAASLQPL